MPTIGGWLARAAPLPRETLEQPRAEGVELRARRAMSMETALARAVSCATLVDKGFELSRIGRGPRAAGGKLKPAILELRCQQRRVARHLHLQLYGHCGSAIETSSLAKARPVSMPGKVGGGQLRASVMRTACNATPCVEIVTLWLDFVK